MSPDSSTTENVLKSFRSNYGIMAKKESFFKKYSKELTFVGVIIICLILLAVSILLVNSYSTILDEQVQTKVELYSNEAEELLNNRISEYKEIAVYAAGKVKSCTSASEVASVVSDFTNDSVFFGAKTVRYYSDGVLYKNSGEVYEDQTPTVIKMAESGQVSSSGIIYDKEAAMPVFAFSAPVTDNNYVQSVIVYYPQIHITDIRNDVKKDGNLQTAEFVALCQLDGTIVSTIHNPHVFMDSNGDFIDALVAKSNDNDLRPIVQRLITENKRGSINVTISGISYWLTISGNGNELGFIVFSLYRSDESYTTGYNFVNVVLTSVIVLLIILIIFAVYFIISRRIMNKRIDNLGMYDDELDCLTELGFEREAPKIMELHKSTKFAVVICDVNHYEYLIETFGVQAGNEILEFLRTLFKRNMQQGETFGHIEDSQFVLLLHYREIQILLNRLKALHNLAMNNVNTKKYKLVLDFGIYEVHSNEEKVSMMMSNAMLAKKSDVRGVLQNNYKLYNDIFKEQYMQEADVEVRMDAALENNEFKVFFQPKLNLTTSKIDGCEALVRWYDTEKDYYRPPGTFLPLFEENGFITKLDKYIYYKVCEFLGNRISHGLRVYPTSVNISRLTAQLDDFLEYYTTVKKQFNIPDNFVTLEFTESVAYENYDLLNRIAKVLHSNGFYCSIDDFGAGYSSFNLLKNMDMDEIKLDRFFLEKGLNAERDRTIWESVIRLGNELNMKVTQEGVETQDIMLYLKRIGCHVVQGYYFSKPLTMADYITFIERSEQEEYKYLDNLGLAEPE